MALVLQIHERTKNAPRKLLQHFHVSWPCFFFPVGEWRVAQLLSPGHLQRRELGGGPVETTRTCHYRTQDEGRLEVVVAVQDGESQYCILG